jgi:hypothetical protein
MKFVFCRNWILPTFAAFVLMTASRAEAQWMQQTFQLRPGWNAVFLEVRPEPEDCDAQFAGQPIESVWDWNRSADSVQFVQDPSTLIPGAAGWLTWFPPGHSMAGQGSLFALRDGRPYLIKSTNAQPVTWTVTGKPSLRPLTWRAGTVNLVGFHVGAQAPTFQTLFAGQAGLTGQPVYTLDATGVWRALTDLSTARPKASEAYWVRCRQPSQATGTILVEGASRDGLTFTPAAADKHPDSQREHRQSQHLRSRAPLGDAADGPSAVRRPGSARVLAGQLRHHQFQLGTVSGTAEFRCALGWTGVEHSAGGPGLGHVSGPARLDVAKRARSHGRSWHALARSHQGRGAVASAAGLQTASAVDARAGRPGWATPYQRSSQPAHAGNPSPPSRRAAASRSGSSCVDYRDPHGCFSRLPRPQTTSVATRTILS